MASKPIKIISKFFTEPAVFVWEEVNLETPNCLCNIISIWHGCIGMELVLGWEDVNKKSDRCEAVW